MANNERPDQEALLKALLEKEMKRPKGRLKIFFGMAAGVGKTYAMLEEAHKRLKEGVNVIVGLVETHGRKETEKLLEGLKVIPEKQILYREKSFKELDIDEILKIKPELVLIDELAHSNIPGSRHAKRWQDVMEILEAGIDVYSTLNIQHIESRKEIVEGITGIIIRETVPDLVLESATDIELVDITPAELIQRLKEGKVYTGELSDVAIQNFFQEDRLTALREIALRLTAEKVDHELHAMISALRRGKGWKPRDRLMVAINDKAYSQQLIRATRRLSFHLDSPWIAVYVDTGLDLSEEESQQLSQNLSLARELGAEVITTQDPDIAKALQRVAEEKEITQIIIGRAPKNGLRGIFRHFKILGRLAKESSGIDIHVIRQPSLALLKKKKIQKKSFFQRFLPYLHILLWTALLSGVSAFALPYLGYKVIGFFFLIGTIILGLFFKRGPLFLASFLFTLIWILFIPPLKEWNISNPEDIAFVVVFLFTALFVGGLTHRIKVKQNLLAKRERSTRAIYEIVKEIASAPSLAHLIKAVKDHLDSVLKGHCEIIIKQFDNGLNFKNAISLLEDEKEKAVALWVFEKGKEAGWSTKTLSGVKNLFIPLKGFTEVVGVLAFRPLVDQPLLPEEASFLSTVAQQLSYYLERTFIEERERKTKHLEQIEKIYEKILRSISQEMNPPLNTIQNDLSLIKNEKVVTDNLKLLVTIEQMDQSFKSLSRIAENSSAMAKLSAGYLTFHKEPHVIFDFLNAFREKRRSSLKDHVLKLSIASNLPQVSFDEALIEILLGNLLSNAIEYSPAKTVIEIEAEATRELFILSVSDQGKGIPEELMERVFERFYRVPGTTSTGIGLGLAIAKSIAELHHGIIKAQNRPMGGAKFSLVLPLNE